MLSLIPYALNDNMKQATKTMPKPLTKSIKEQDQTVVPVKVHMPVWLRDELSIQAIREGKERSKLIVDVLKDYVNNLDEE
jgi:hypothetical protein